jgi:tRNA threonylcarbamoyladenosine biosynthesis protein TsaB
MSLILSLETTTMTCSIALLKGDACWILKEQKDMGDHAEKLTLYIQELMQSADLPLSALDAIAVSKGPGSYTGLRIGVSVAKGLCFSLNKPLLAVDTLKSMAYAVSTQHQVQNNDIIVSLQDARRMDAFAAIYDAQLNEIKAPHFLTLEEDSFQEYQKEGGKIWLCGNAAAKMPQTAENLTLSNIDGPSARFAEQLAFNSLQAKDFEDLAYFEPFYLKPPNVTKPKSNKYFKNL